MPLDRRRFVQLAAAATASAARRGLAAPLSPGSQPLRTVGYDQVKVGGRAAQQQATAQAVLSTLDDDALLKPFRVMGNLPAPGRDLGGWYQYLPDYNWHTGDAGLAPGHCFGQWTSAMARFAAAQGDAAARDRILQLHLRFAQAITPNFFDFTRYPAYTLDKLNIGLLDAHTLLDSPEALAIADKVRQCALANLPGSALERDRVWRRDRDFSYTWDESYTLPENLYGLYQAGAGSVYRTMARAYLFDSFFAPLSRNENILGGLHGYSHTNALGSAVRAWQVDGSEMHLQAALNGFRMMEAQTFATGGSAPDELFEAPGSGKLLASLSNSHSSFETPCGTYAWLKLSRALLQITQDGHYGDSMERILLNSMFGALPLQPDGRTFYYADLNQDARKVYSAHRWPCCSGTYPQVAADYGVNTYLLGPADDPSVWVNLFLPSTLRWTQAGTEITLEQGDSEASPESNHFRIHTSRPISFSLRLRAPTWCSTPRLLINGRPTSFKLKRGFADVNRNWQPLDRIEWHLPATLRLEAFPADGGPPQPNLVALCFGPWVLMATTAMASATANQLLQAERIDATTWRVARPEGDLHLTPYFNIGDGPYTTYLRLT